MAPLKFRSAQPVPSAAPAQPHGVRPAVAAAHGACTPAASPAHALQHEVARRLLEPAAPQPQRLSRRRRLAIVLALGAAAWAPIVALGAVLR